MGHTTVTIKVENYIDVATASKSKAKRGKKIRTVIIPDALIDTGATHLCLPSRYIKQLGLVPYPKEVSAQTASGFVMRKMYGGAWLTIQDRCEECSVIEVPDSVSALVGVIPLEGMDFIVDPVDQKLIGKHGAKRVSLMY